jgi:hypothetical protein
MPVDSCGHMTAQLGDHRIEPQNRHLPSYISPPATKTDGYQAPPPRHQGRLREVKEPEVADVDLRTRI